MGIWENIALALAGIKANKMRALLTMLGIIIGISSVITISTLGSIMTASVTDIFNEQGGANLVGFGVTTKENAIRKYLYTDDYITEEMIMDVKDRFADQIDAVAMMSGNSEGSIMLRREQMSVTVYGVNDGYVKQSQTPVVAGRYISETDCTKMRDICVISDRQAKKLFGSERGAVGQNLDVTVTVKKKSYLFSFTVVGVYRYKISALESMLASGLGVNVEDWNSEIYVPYTLLKRIGEGRDYFYSFNVNTKTGVDADDFCNEVKNYLNKAYYRENDAAEIISQTAQSQMAMIDQILGTVSLVISIIAGISLLVGGIGVMNIMLVSVTERTREIGVRKALGAPNSAIRIQFIVESIIICLIGGVIGIGLGMLTGNIAGFIVGTHAVPSIGSILLAVGFSMGIGVFFGYYPANRAAKLDPIEALRYE